MLHGGGRSTVARHALSSPCLHSPQNDREHEEQDRGHDPDDRIRLLDGIATPDELSVSKYVPPATEEIQRLGVDVVDLVRSLDSARRRREQRQQDADARVKDAH